MNLEFIYEFVVLVQMGKFQAAADVLFMSQPTLSKHIINLEKTLGQDLIVHSKNHRLQLTDFGTRFLPYALQLANIYQEVQTKFMQNTNRNLEHIVIGTSPIVPLYPIFEFMDTYANCKISVINASQENLPGLLRTRQCDLAVVYDFNLNLQDHFEMLEYGHDVLAAILPKDHICAACTSASITDLQQEQFIELNDSGIFLLWCKACAKEELAPQNHINVPQISTILDMIDNHRGITLMPRSQAIHFAGDRLAVVNIIPELTITYHVIYRKNDMQTKPLHDLLEHLLHHNP